MRHLLRVDDLSRAGLLEVLRRGEANRRRMAAGLPAARRLSLVVGLLFLSPSTRTRVGFASAACRLGGGWIDVGAPRWERGMSAAESLEDTVRATSAYCDVLVARHPEADAIARIAASSACAVVNAGSGNDEHPTQALIDLFAMERGIGRIEGLRIGFAGDLRGSRAAKSLLRVLRHVRPVSVLLMHPSGRGPGDEPCAGLDCPVNSSTVGLDDLDQIDVLYMAGFPPGHGRGQVATSIRRRWRLDRKRLDTLPAASIVLCPLPRVDEIASELDDDPRCRWFQQSADGLAVRMAVLERFSGRR